MPHREEMAHITCACGEVFQHVPRGGEDWDEDKSAGKLRGHLQAGCSVTEKIENENKKRLKGTVG